LIIGIASYGLDRDRYLMRISKLSGSELRVINDILFEIFKFDEVNKYREISVQTENEQDDERLVEKLNESEKIINQFYEEKNLLEAEIQSLKSQNEISEKMISEIKSENNKIIDFLKQRVIQLEEDNKFLRNGKNIEEYLLELSTRIEEEKTRSNSLASSTNKIETDDSDVKTLKAEIAKLTRQNSILIERYTERSQSADSEELNYID
jgi:hypothetical protein